MQAHRVLIVDDDPDILRIMQDNLELDGYRVIVAATGRAALESVRIREPDLVILDLALPDIDGIRVCRCIRDLSEVPIIMLTARDRVADKVLGLEAGADDYLVKPFDYLELAARIKACLRRYRTSHGASDIVEVGDLKIDGNQRIVWKKGEKVQLTHRQFSLLLLLVRNAGRALSRSEIRRHLWPDQGLYAGSRAIDVHVQHLRSKLEEDPGNPVNIITVQGVGYMWSDKGSGLVS